MVVKVERVDGCSELFETSQYLISNKDLFPTIQKIYIYEGGKKIKVFKRKFRLFYKLFIFPSKKVQDTLKEIQELREQKNENVE